MGSSFYEEMKEPQSGFGMMHDIRNHVDFASRKVSDATWCVQQAINNIEYLIEDGKELDDKSINFALTKMKEAIEELKKVTN